MPIHDSDTFVGTTCAIIGNQTETQAIDHVGLLATTEPFELKRRQRTEVFDMGNAPALAEMRADLMGCLGHLDSDTQKEMRLWALKVIRRGTKIKYQALPASTAAVLEKTSDALVYESFSCAGFVDRCYRDAAGVQLVVEEEHLPPLGVKTLSEIWTSRQRALGHPGLRARIGLVGEEPWRILMPAYLFHAIRHFDDKGTEAGPYQPVRGDWQFPRATTGA